MARDPEQIKEAALDLMAAVKFAMDVLQAHDSESGFHMCYRIPGGAEATETLRAAWYKAQTGRDYPTHSVASDKPAHRLPERKRELLRFLG
jgi:hypothetical protein